MQDIIIPALLLAQDAQLELQLVLQQLVDQPAHAYLDISYHHLTVILAQEMLLLAQLLLLFQLVILVTH